MAGRSTGVDRSKRISPWAVGGAYMSDKMPAKSPPPVGRYHVDHPESMSAAGSKRMMKTKGNSSDIISSILLYKGSEVVNNSRNDARSNSRSRLQQLSQRIASPRMTNQTLQHNITSPIRSNEPIAKPETMTARERLLNGGASKPESLPPIE